MRIVIGFAVAGVLLGGVISQSTYVDLSAAVSRAGSDAADSDAGGQVWRTTFTALSLFVNPTESLSDMQRLLLGFLSIGLWLMMVWLLRQWLLGNRPSIREAAYSCGGPIAASLLLALLLVLQLLPLGIAAMVYQGLVAAEVISGGLSAMLSGFIVGLVATLSLYWATSTLVALVVATLPGMYPLRALRAANELVAGRRIRIMLRIVWAIACMALVWLAVVVPLMFLDAWARSQWGWLQSVPVIPYIMMVIIAVGSVWLSSYVYLLYRRIVDHDAR